MPVVYVSAEETLNEAIERLRKKVRRERLNIDYKQHVSFMTDAERQRAKANRYQKRKKRK